MNDAQRTAHRERQRVRSAAFRAAGRCSNRGGERDDERLRCARCRASDKVASVAYAERRAIRPRPQPGLPFYSAPVHQVIPTFTPPLRGSIAMQMAWAGLRRTA